MELPLVQDKLAPSSINIGSNAWFSWLAQNKSFKYHPSSKNYHYLRCDITVRNRTKDYWYAYRKVNSVQRTYYLGKTKDLDYEKLQQAVDELSLSDPQYQKLISDRRKGVQENVYNPPQASKELLKLQEKYNQLAREHEELEAKYLLLQESVKGLEIKLINKEHGYTANSASKLKNEILALANSL
jgi:hypothetical protein